MKSWVTIVCVALGISIYRTSVGEPSIIESGIIGGISGAIGAILAMLYERYFGKHHFSIVNFIDNILWFIIFCIPGAILGLLLAAPFNVNMEYGFQTIILLITMIGVSYFLTLRKIKAKNKQKDKMVM